MAALQAINGQMHKECLSRAYTAYRGVETPIKEENAQERVLRACMRHAGVDYPAELNKYFWAYVNHGMVETPIGGERVYKECVPRAKMHRGGVEGANRGRECTRSVLPGLMWPIGGIETPIGGESVPGVCVQGL